MPGKDTSRAEVTNIPRHGLWLLVAGKEYFLPFPQSPWFSEAPVSPVLKVKLPSADHLYWPQLDVDLSLGSIEHPERFPLVARETPAPYGQKKRA
jgi:hypothetical protein